MTVPAQHANGEWSKVVEEIFVHELIVDAEVMRVRSIARLKIARVKGDKVKAVCGERIKCNKYWREPRQQATRLRKSISYSL